MQELAFAICALLAFLLPIGFYCIILASINRRGKPLFVTGVWDSAGLLFAMSGFFLATMPMLLSEFYLRAYHGDRQTDIHALWLSHWLLWIVYFLFLISGAALMVLWRTDKTIVYNVDTDMFSKALEQTFAQLGIVTTRQGSQFILTPAAADGTPDATGVTNAAPAGAAPPRTAPKATALAGSSTPWAELEVETFAAMCNVTLHWDHYSAEAREEIERELEHNLESAAPYDNPSAGWFLNISGLIFGTLLMIVVALIVLIIMARR